MFGVGATVAPFVAGMMMGFFPEDSFKSMRWAYWSLAALCILSAIPTMLLQSPHIEQKEEVISNSRATGGNVTQKYFLFCRLAEKSQVFGY
jgi:MFS family permease